MTVAQQYQGHDLARMLGEVARDLQAQPTVDETLSSMTAAAVETIEGVDHAGITLLEGGRLVSGYGYTHEVARRCDEAQDELQEGPCLHAAGQRVSTVLVPDMSVESRWPRFAARAQELGVRSMLSFLLDVDDGKLGALNLHGTAPDPFADDAQVVGELFATHAAVALAGASEARQLNTALATRDTIGKAKGLLNVPAPGRRQHRLQHAGAGVAGDQHQARRDRLVARRRARAAGPGVAAPPPVNRGALARQRTFRGEHAPVIPTRSWVRSTARRGQRPG